MASFNNATLLLLSPIGNSSAAAAVSVVNNTTIIASSNNNSLTNYSSVLSWVISRSRIFLYLSSPYEESFQFQHEIPDYQTEVGISFLFLPASWNIFQHLFLFI